MAKQRRRTPASRMRSLVTPEGVDLQVKLADAGGRAGAFLLDVVFIMLAGFVLSLIAVFGLGGLGLNRGQPVVIAWTIMVFLLRNAYFLGFEARRAGQTPGKRIMGLRVASRDGSGLAIDQVIARNLMREIEVFLPVSFLLVSGSGDLGDSLTTAFGLVWALLFAFFPLFNRDNMRIGDLLAGTWVIETPKRKLAEDLAEGQRALPSAQFSTAQLDAYGIAELHKLEEVLRGNNSAALRTVADTIGAKIGAAHQASDARPFLTAYYTELRAHLERKLLLGNRKESKFDR